MSSPLTKEALTRNAWLVELRRQGDRQCAGAYELDGNRVCALGLLSQIYFKECLWLNEDVIGAMAGLSHEESINVAAMNDGDNGYHKHTFAEIADVVESWFPQS